MVNWRRGDMCALGIYAFANMWNWFGVVVFHRSMVNWRRGGGISALGICAFFYMWNLFGVVVFQRSMVNWRRGPCYMCILLYVKLIWCSSIPYIYGQLEEGGTSYLSVHFIWKNELTSEFTLASQRSFLWKTNNTTRFYYGGLDLPLHLPIWALTVEMWNCHWNCHSDAVADLPGG